MSKKVEAKSKKAKDHLAQLVLGRFSASSAYKNTVKGFRGLTPNELFERCDYAYRKEFSPDVKQAITDTFGIPNPTRYFGLIHTKVNATKAWKRDLVAANMDNMFAVMPTPIPTLDAQSLNSIRAEVRSELQALLAQNGVFDALQIISAYGEEVPHNIKAFIDDTIKRLRGVETAREIALAKERAGLIYTKLRDVLVESNFRREYGMFSHSQLLYGLGVMKFPNYRKVADIKHSGNKATSEYRILPDFRCVSVFNIFPTPDGQDYQTCAGITELAYISKIELIKMADTDGYSRSDIIDILKEYGDGRERNWLPDYISSYSNGVTIDNSADGYWDLDGKIPVLIHEGYVSGRELRDFGISGIDDLEYVNAEIVVCAGRTIKTRMLKSPDGEERSYFSAPFMRYGDGMWDTVGVAGMLLDTEERINKALYTLENNMAMASTPPVLMNPDAFEDDNVALQAGKVYKVNQDALLQYQGRLPEPLRPVSGYTAQYQLILSIVMQLIRMSDDECGIPAYAYSGANFGQSSLGEYSQRMSNSLRVIKEAAHEEDTHFISPAFQLMFRRIVKENADLAEGQDIHLQVRGLTGLLSTDIQKSNVKERLATLVSLSQVPDLIPREVLEYTVREYLSDEQIPVEALGIGDPLTDNALASAASAIGNEAGVANSFMQPQVPQLDGRSRGVMAGTTANAQGLTNYNVGTNQYTNAQAAGAV